MLIENLNRFYPEAHPLVVDSDCVGVPALLRGTNNNWHSELLRVWVPGLPIFFALFGHHLNNCGATIYFSNKGYHKLPAGNCDAWIPITKQSNISWIHGTGGRLLRKAKPIRKFHIKDHSLNIWYGGIESQAYYRHKHSPSTDQNTPTIKTSLKEPAYAITKIELHH